MSSKSEKIIEIANQANAADLIEIWTNTFKVKGTLLKDEGRTIKGVVTLMDAEIDSFFNECSCGCCETTKETWLNIFEDQIIGFTIIKAKEA